MAAKFRQQHGGRRRGSGRRRKHRVPKGWYLYVIHETDILDVCKIGISSIQTNLRLATLQTGNWRTLIIDKTFDVGSKKEAIQVETAIHVLLFSKRLKGEWFHVDVKTAVDTATAVLEAVTR